MLVLSDRTQPSYIRATLL